MSYRKDNTYPIVSNNQEKKGKKITGKSDIGWGFLFFLGLTPQKFTVQISILSYICIAFVIHLAYTYKIIKVNVIHLYG